MYRNNIKSIENLYVACKVSEIPEVIEPFVQQDTFGKCLHHLIVFPKRVLLYKNEVQDEFYIIDTNELVKVRSTESSVCSYETESSPWLNNVYNIQSGFSTFNHRLNRKFLSDLKIMYNQYSFITPLSDFIEYIYGKKNDVISLQKAKKMISIYNITKLKSILLDFDPEIANRQLEKIGYFSKSEKILKKFINQ